MRLVVARIGRAHGLRGEVTVEVRTDSPGERFVPGAVLHVPDGGRASELAASGRPVSLTVAGARDHNGILLLTFTEVRDRTAAEELRDVLLEADVPDDDVEDADAWYEHELVGLRVEDPAGEVLGELVALDHLPHQDLITVRRPDGEDRLVPFVTAIVPVVDVPGGRVVVDAPPGLITDLPGD